MNKWTMLGLVLGSNEAMCVSYLLSVKFCQVKGKTYKLQVQSMTKKKKKNDTRYNWITYQNCSLDSSKSAFRIVEVFKHRVLKSDMLLLNVFSLNIVFVLSDKILHDVR